MGDRGSEKTWGFGLQVTVRTTGIALRLDLGCDVETGSEGGLRRTCLRRALVTRIMTWPFSEPRRQRENYVCRMKRRSSTSHTPHLGGRIDYLLLHNEFSPNLAS